MEGNMLGDKIKQCFEELCEFGGYDIEEFEEELKELDELKEELFNANKWASHYEDKYNELKEDALLGKALTWAVETGEKFIIIEEPAVYDSMRLLEEDIPSLLSRYQQQLEKIGV